MQLPAHLHRLFGVILSSIASFLLHCSCDPEFTGTCSYCRLHFQWPPGLPTSLTLRPSLSFPCPLIRAVVCNLYRCCRQDCCQSFPHLPFHFLDKQDLVYFSIVNLQLWLYNSTKDIDTGVRGVRTMVLLNLCLVATECCLASQLGLLSLLSSSRPAHPWCGVLIDSGDAVSASECFFPRLWLCTGVGWPEG